MSVIFIILFSSVGSVYSDHAEIYQATSVCSTAAMESSSYLPPHINQKNSNYLGSHYWVRHYSQTKIYEVTWSWTMLSIFFGCSHFHHKHLVLSEYIITWLVINKPICAKMAKCQLSFGQTCVPKHGCQAMMSSDDLITLGKQYSWQRSFIWGNNVEIQETHY